MTDREKLIELLSDMWQADSYEEIADHLIANGVTVQRWIPVTERLPETGVLVMCACNTNALHVLSYDDVMDDWDAMYGHVCFRKEFVTHWMPLPEPPKEGHAND